MHAHRWIVLGGLLAGPLALCAQTGYFQQRVDHVINVRLDDVHHLLSAEETFTYTNNAPQALDTLWIHLWPNAYSDRSTALCEQLDGQNNFILHFATDAQRGRIDSLDFTDASSGAKLVWGYHPQHVDIGWIKLNAPLQHGEHIGIHTPFRVKVPSARISRLGHIGQAYYITQWFPKPAVFDNKGWHAMPYLTQGEFYSEYGSYDVHITLPANYVVGATGELQDATERAFMDSLAQVPPSFVMGRGGDPFPRSASAMKTVHFVQQDVHDFAWFADKRFQVRKGSVTLPRSGRTVTTWVLVTPHNAAMWSDAITYVNESVRLYSEWVGDYLYSACTAIDGGTAAGGGMEYPMITIINDSDSPFELDVVIAHEVGHNWFYGMLGSNEREHAWMDEGINSFYEERYVETRYPGKRIMDLQGIPLGFLTKHQGVTYLQQDQLQYRYNARRNWDSPIESHATAFAELDYGTTVYSKTALVFDQLRDDLGPALFDQAMQRYFSEWHLKHPYPQDLRSLLEHATDKDLHWYFDTLIGTSAKVDFRHHHRDDRTGFVHAGSDTHAAIDIDPRNDQRWRLPEVKFLAGLEREDRKSIYWTPAVGYNTHDGWMGGVALYNTVLPSQRFEWAAAPLYGFASQRLAGGARFMWNHDRLQGRALRNLHIGVSGFAASLNNVGPVELWYQRLVPSVQADLRLPATGPQLNVKYRSILLWHHAEFPADMVATGPAVTNDVFHELSANMAETHGLHPWSAQVIALHHEAFTRLAFEGKWSALYDAHRHRVTFRAFAGTFLRKDEQLMTAAMGWRMYWGSSDLLYDHLFIDRQSVGQNTAQQFVPDQGGFRTPTAVGTSDSWIAAANMELDFPFILPLTAFASYGAAPYTRITSDGRVRDWKGYAEAGLGVRLWRDKVEVWVPLAFSEDIQKEMDLRNFDFTERIRFVLALEKLDPTQGLRQAPH